MGEKRRKKRALRRKEMGSDYEEDAEDQSDNEIVGDEFDDDVECKENESSNDQMEEVGLEEAESRRSSHQHTEEEHVGISRRSPGNHVGMNGNEIVEETQNGDLHS